MVADSTQYYHYHYYYYYYYCYYCCYYYYYYYYYEDSKCSLFQAYVETIDRIISTSAVLTKDKLIR